MIICVCVCVCVWGVGVGGGDGRGRVGEGVMGSTLAPKSFPPNIKIQSSRYFEVQRTL